MRRCRIALEVTWDPLPSSLEKQRDDDTENDFARRDWSVNLRPALEKLHADGVIAHYHVLEKPCFRED